MKVESRVLVNTMTGEAARISLTAGGDGVLGDVTDYDVVEGTFYDEETVKLIVKALGLAKDSLIMGGEKEFDEFNTKIKDALKVARGNDE